MLYLGIDQHAKQITVCVRSEEGDAVLRRQVSGRAINGGVATQANPPQSLFSPRRMHRRCIGRT